jgi:2-C-methyl-D-erythritol 2,4-cyclodiphosphate synthase
MKKKQRTTSKKNQNASIRIGFGYDIHRLVEGRKLILGGIRIPSKFGLLGHSDADVLLHAICDAILGAAALGDIGKHFPDTNEKFRGISSLKLLNQVGIFAENRGFQIGNIDSTIVLDRPKIANYVDLMRRRIGKALRISPALVSIKATTHEGLGALGRGEGVAAYAVASIIVVRSRT